MNGTMLQDRIHTLRVQNCISQEEFALRLGVVRQTVSKWERGISVPDADTLIKIAEILNVTVSELLGEEFKINDESSKNKVSHQLERLNGYFAERSQRSKKILKIMGIVLLVILLVSFLLIMLTIRF